MNINTIKTTSPIFFRGYGGTTENTKSNYKIYEFIHESHFMRNLESLSFTTDYLKENFPNGTHIADFGCSNGEEAYSLATLLHGLNKDGRYKITGFDIIPEVVEDAKIGVFDIGLYLDNRKGKVIEDNYEKFLLENTYWNVDPIKEQAKKNFKECFEEVPDKWKYFNIHHPRYKHKVKRVIQPNQDIEIITKKLEYLLLPNKRKESGIKSFVPKEGLFKDIVDFKVADIMDIDKELPPQKNGIVIFKNSLYHILGSRVNDHYNRIKIGPAEELFKKINFILPDKGLFVLGNLHHDHFFNRRTMLNKCIELYQNGKQITVFNSSPIHKTLEKFGFEPIFYECDKTGDISFKNLSTYLPSVWKKIRHI